MNVLFFFHTASARGKSETAILLIRIGNLAANIHNNLPVQPSTHCHFVTTVLPIFFRHDDFVVTKLRPRLLIDMSAFCAVSHSASFITTQTCSFHLKYQLIYSIRCVQRLPACRDEENFRQKQSPAIRINSFSVESHNNL